MGKWKFMRYISTMLEKTKHFHAFCLFKAG